jgi:hypothetical protein
LRAALKAEIGLKIRAGDGLAQRGFPELMGTARFYAAEAGDRLVLLDARYKFAVATYRPEIKDEWLYTYAYAPEEAWVAYNGDLSGESYRQGDYAFGGDAFFRVSLRRVDGLDFGGGEDLADILAFERSDALRFALLADTHYTVNGTWDTTAASIWAANRRRPLDGIIHLGDFTDGIASKEVCADYAGLMLDDLKAIGVPVWAALGNHDANCFRNNPARLTPREQCALYLGREEPHYLVDFETHRLRLFFLDSYDPDLGELRYGFSPECVAWLESGLEAMPAGWGAIVFSHVGPLARLQVWVKEIRGEAEIIAVLNAHADKVLAFINGHVHADILCNDHGFPIIALGCAKCEHELAYKIEGAFTPERRPGTASQELWDILSVDTAGRTLAFRRQGAGKSRIVTGGKAQWL